MSKSEGEREVDVWTTPQGTYVKDPSWKRGTGPWKDLDEAVKHASAQGVAFPFLLNMRDPAEVPENEWPITRKRKQG